MARLERQMIPRRTSRVIFRIVGPGSEKLPQPTQDELEEGNPVVTFKIVESPPLARFTGPP